MNKRIIITVIALALIITASTLGLGQYNLLLASFIGSFMGVMIIPILILSFLYMTKLRNRLKTKAVVVIFIILSLYGIIYGIDNTIETQRLFINATVQQAAEELQQELKLPHKWGDSVEITDIYAEDNNLVLKLLYKDDVELSRDNVAPWLCNEMFWRDLLEQGASIRFDYSTAVAQSANSISIKNDYCTL